MVEITQENIAEALRLLQRARVMVGYVEAVAEDAFEKVDNFISTLERQVAELEPTDAGGREEPSRQDKVQYIKDVLDETLGFQGVWDNDTLVERFSDKEIDDYYKQIQEFAYPKQS